MHLALCVLTFLAIAAAPARGAVQLADDGSLASLTAAGGLAYAAVQTDARSRPYRLVRSTGSGVNRLGRFGPAKPEWLELGSSRNGRALAAYATLGSDYLQYVRALPSASGRAFGVEIGRGIASGPAQLAFAGERSVLAYPDRAGNVVLNMAGGEGYQAPIAQLTDDAPAVRHSPRDAAATPSGEDVLVLDRAQTRGRTSLRVLGAGAPAEAVISIASRRALESSLAVAPDGTLAVAYVSGGSVFLARRRPGEDGWDRAELAGGGAADGTPSIAATARRIHVAWAEGKAGRRDVRLATASLGGQPSARRHTSARADDRDPRLAATTSGQVFLAWTRGPRAAPAVLLERL